MVMKNLLTTALILSSALLLSLSANTYAGVKIISLDGCLMELYNQGRQQVILVNLEEIDVIRHSTAYSVSVVTLEYGGSGIIEIRQLSNEQVNGIKTVYKECIN